MQATEKSREIDELLTWLTGRDRIECIEVEICIQCDQPIGPFTDGISQREYEISGLCQDCQDLTFG